MVCNYHKERRFSVLLGLLGANCYRISILQQPRLYCVYLTQKLYKQLLKAFKNETCGEIPAAHDRRQTA